jgi:hypothetical protein
MKKSFFLFFLLLLFFTRTMAQDIIITKEEQRIEAKILMEYDAVHAGSRLCIVIKNP